ncbi:hypothetical protein EGW08_012788 [Elysia chlorotica]|uniref:Kinesin motor domain-containing protein n=1 Tax=Elysia chlorotica TaxID=188477 RepID=A0A3S1HHG8_ELYCH|nr:hypothetical protein EGW08_012788 [Elysia chlorotica]
MGTLYECLREARLEQFYPAFQANSITRSEDLINLGMPEFFALGITANEDVRRLVELVNIIKDVHSSGFSASPAAQRRTAGQRQAQGNSPNVDISEAESARGPSHARGRGRTGNRPHQSQYESSASATDPRHEFGESDVRDRVPNFSAASYLDMMQYMSESSQSDDADGDDSDEEPYLQPPMHMVPRAVSASHAVRSSVTRTPGAAERVKPKGYNYGVPKVSTPSKAKPSRAGGGRGARDRDDKIKVCVRKRPLTRRELRAKDEDIVAVESTTTLIVNEPKLAVDLKAYTLQHEFIFDEVFHESCSNEDVYTRAARPLISCIFNGGTATCFAYGQTGAGKTHTMLGDEETPGLYLLAGRDIFSIISSGQHGRGLHVWISFFEIYCGQLFDLLNRRNRVHPREDGSRQVCIAGLTETEATDVKSLVQTLQYGNSVRSKGSTGVNPDSSRSHAILQLDIRNSEDVKVGKISFIDLAGSERASDVTDSDKQTRMEGAEINQSLLALKECIRSIDQDSRHTPFRQSKLTHILKDSFIGNSRTCMIANISPSQSACENTLNTLRYADRVKELKRDSLRSSTVSQAMNLLMNIPPTAPSIFHPSNVLSTSTPMRPQAQARRERQSRPPAPERNDITLDLSETPIRGHNLPRRSAAREVAQRAQHASPGQGADRPGDAVSPPIACVATAQTGTSSRYSALAASAASHGSAVPPPDASPSESDHTDTDSNNMTHQTLKLAPGLRDRRNTVAGSMDTEFDFPTSDFNNPEEFNDLNHPQPKEQKAESRGVQNPIEQSPVAASGAETASPTVVHVSETRRPVLKPVVYRSVDVEADTASPSNMQVARHKFQASAVSSPKISQYPPSVKRAPLVKELFSSDESINDEDLLADGPSIDHYNTMNNLAAPPSTQTNASALPLHSSRGNITNKRLMVPQPADSSDLTKFSQRPSLQPAQHETTNDLSHRPSQFSQASTAAASAAHYTTTANHKHPTAYRAGEKSPSTRRKSPNMRSPTRHEPKHPLENDLSAESKASPEERRGGRTHLSRQSPYSLEHTPHPPASPPSGRHPSPPTPDRGHSGTAVEVPQPGAALKQPADEVCGSTRVRKYSDSSDTKVQLRRASGSPTGDKSDDSTETIRASLSDQGQGGYRRYRDTDRASMRKERSDPMLALDLQRKKQTLPDPQSISKRLTRNNMPKTGLSHRDPGGGGGGSSWKVIHDQFPSPKSGAGLTPPPSDHSGLGQGDRLGCGSQSEPSSLGHETGGETGFPGQNQEALDPSPGHAAGEWPEQHFSDGGGQSKPRSAVRSRDGRHRRSPGHGDSSAQANIASKDSPGDMAAARLEAPPTSQQAIVTQMPQIPFPVPVNTCRMDSSANNKASPKPEHQAAAHFRAAAKDLTHRNSAMEMEKLGPGVTFSPIHPYPVTMAGTRVVTEPATSSSVLFQPTPVSVSSASPFSSVAEHTPKDECPEPVRKARSELISAHEDQLANITSLCKQEMRLLLNAKNGKRGFEDYVRRVSDILQQKMTAIAALQGQISYYRSNHYSHPASSTSRQSVAASVSESSGTDKVATSYRQQP